MKTISNLNKVFTRTLRCLLAAILLVASPHSSYAHNKVVVIPMAGDDVPADIEPTAPLAKVDPSQTDYTIMTDTVIDKITSLEWQRQDDNVTRNWNDAFDYCAGFFLDFTGGFRLPDVLELQSIVDYDGSQPAIDTGAFPNITASSYWSASSDAGSSAGAWVVFFSTGIISPRDKVTSHLVRCVRQRQG